MMHYSVQPRDQIFVKGYGFLSFAKNIGKNIGKNICKNLSGTYSQKLLDQATQSVTDALQTTSERIIKKNNKKKQQKQLMIWLVIKVLMQ